MRAFFPGALFLLLGSAAIGQATVFTFNQTIALDSTLLNTNVGNQSYYQEFPNNPTFTIQSGDSITGLITFANGPIGIQSAAGSFTDALELEFEPTSSSIYDATSDSSSWQGLVIAPGTSTPVSNSGTSGFGSIVGTFPGSGAFDFSVTGVTYTVTFNTVRVQSPSGALTSSPFSLNFLFVQGDTVTLGSVAPEPASGGYCIVIGLALVFCAKARRSQRRA